MNYTYDMSSTLIMQAVNLLNMKTMPERLAFALARAGISQSELARRMGVTRGAISLLLKSADGQMTAANNDKAADALGIDARWLATGRGKPPEDIPEHLASSDEKQPAEPTESNLRAVPWPLPAIPREKIEALAKDPAKLERLQGAVGMALAMLEQGAGGVPVQRVGTPDAANDGAFEAIRKLPVKIAATISGVAPNDIHLEGSGTFLVPTAWIRSKGLHPESLIAVEVKGMSMYPRVHEGDTVVLNVADKQRQVNQVYAFNHEGEFTLKRAEKRANRWYLVSENPDQSKYPPVPCTESTALIGKVVLMHAEQV